MFKCVTGLLLGAFRGFLTEKINGNGIKTRYFLQHLLQIFVDVIDENNVFTMKRNKDRIP